MAIITTYKKNSNYEFLAHFSGGGNGCPHLFRNKKTQNYIIWNPDNNEVIKFSEDEFKDLKNLIKKNKI